MENERRYIALATSHNVRHGFWRLGADEEGEPLLELEEFNAKTFQVTGEFAGAVVEIVGQIIPKTFELLSDYDNIPLTFVAEGVKSTDDGTLLVMPRVRGGNASTKLIVGALIRR